MGLEYRDEDKMRKDDADDLIENVRVSVSNSLRIGARVADIEEVIIIKVCLVSGYNIELEFEITRCIKTQLV